MGAGLSTLSFIGATHARRMHAFTVVELLVASGITVLLSALMITVIVNALNSWNRSHGALAAETQARLVLDQLTADLAGALFRNDGNVWFAATVQTNTTLSRQWTGVGKPIRDADSLDLTASGHQQNPAGQLAETRFGVGGVWLRFITSAPANSPIAPKISGPVAVGYQIIRRSPPGAAVGADTHYLFYRSEVTPENTFAAGYNLDPTTGGYKTSSALDGDVGNIVNPPPLRFIADNVIDFGVRLYVRENSVLVNGVRQDGVLSLIFPALPAAQRSAPGKAKPGGELSDGSSPTEREHLVSSITSAPADYYRHSRPDVVDVMVRILTAEGARQIQALEAGKQVGDWWTIATLNSKVFTRRIIINPSPL